MLRLGVLEAHNWCQHEYLRLDLSGPATVVCGPNGSGKSNGVYAAVAALTGTPMNDDIVDNIRHGADSATLILEFWINGTRCHIRRVWTAKEIALDDGKVGRGKVSQTVELTVAGEMPVKKPAPVLERLQDLFGLPTGVPVSSIFDHIFIAQGGMEQILFSDTERTDSIGRLIPAVSRASAAIKACNEELAEVPEMQVTVPSSEVSLAIAGLDCELELVSQEKSSLVAEVAGEWWWTEGALEKRMAEVKAVAEQTEAVRRAEACLTDAARTLDAANAKLDGTAAPTFPEQPKSDRAFALGFLSVYKDLLKKRETLEADIAKAKAAGVVTCADGEEDKMKELRNRILLSDNDAGRRTVAAAIIAKGSKAASLSEKQADLLAMEAEQLELRPARDQIAAAEREAEGKVAVAESELRKLKQSKDGACPTCGNQIQNYAGKLAEAQANLKNALEARGKSTALLQELEAACLGADAGIKTLQSEVAKLTAEEETYQRAVSELSGLTPAVPQQDRQDLATLEDKVAKARASAAAAARLEAATAELATLKPAAQIHKEAEEASDVVLDWKGYEALYSQAQREAALRDALSAAVAAAQEQLKSADKELTDANERLAAATANSDPLLPVGIDELHRLTALRNEVNTELRVLDEKAAGVTRVKDAELKKLERALAEEEAAKEIQAYRRALENVKTVFHRDNLPTALITRSIVRLEDEVNRFLAGFTCPFVIKVVGAASISCVFENGYVCRPKRLSGGQKCALSVAFRFAMANVFASSLGLLVLDEPTEYLDQENRENIVDVIEHATRVGSEAGMQLIVITHATELMDAFPNKIELEAA